MDRRVLRVLGERPKTEQELKEFRQRKVKTAALYFVEKKCASKPAALRSVGLCCFKYRTTLDYQVELLQKLHVSNGIEPASEPIPIAPVKKVSRKRVNTPVITPDKPALRAQKYSSAFKWMTEESISNPKKSLRLLALEAQSKFNTPVGKDSAKKAKTSPDVMSPKRHGPEPKYPRHFEMVIVDVVLKLRWGFFILHFRLLGLYVSLL